MVQAYKTPSGATMYVDDNGIDLFLEDQTSYHYSHSYDMWLDEKGEMVSTEMYVKLVMLCAAVKLSKHISGIFNKD